MKTNLKVFLLGCLIGLLFFLLSSCSIVYDVQHTTWGEPCDNWIPYYVPEWTYTNDSTLLQ